MVATLIVVPKYEQLGVIQFLKMENVSDSEIHARMCKMYGVQNIIIKSTVNQRVQRFKAEWTSMNYEPWSSRQAAAYVGYGLLS